MCRLLGIVTSEPTHFHFSLHAAPRSLATLSCEHPDGWGIGVYDPQKGFTVRKHPVRASHCQHFHDASQSLRGVVLLAHVRAMTVGRALAKNTHPFRRGRWLFAHNGTLSASAIDFLRAHTSTERLQQIEGETDSELFFSYLLTGFDRAGVSETAASEETDRALERGLTQALAQPSFGACNFLLSDGDTLYAHRAGRTLYLLERRPPDRVRIHRESHETGAAIDTPWGEHRHAILIASEAMTDEPWVELAEGTLLRCEREPLPRLQLLRGSTPHAYAQVTL